jgi:beta-alanine--pyruvate transaminase
LNIENENDDEYKASWLPFTVNRQFKEQPSLLTEAKGMYFTAEDGRQILVGTAELYV